MLTLLGCSQSNQSIADDPFGDFNKFTVKRRIKDILKYAGAPFREDGEIKHSTRVNIVHYDDLPFVATATQAEYLSRIEDNYECLYFQNTNEHWEVIILNPKTKCPDQLSYFEKVADYVYYSELKYE